MKFMDILHFKKAAKQNIIGRWLISLKDELQSRSQKEIYTTIIKTARGGGNKRYFIELLCRTHYARLEIRV